MKNNIKEYLGWITAAITIIVAIMVVGQYKEKIERLEENQKLILQHQFEQQQWNGEVKGILSSIIDKI